MSSSVWTNHQSTSLPRIEGTEFVHNQGLGAILLSCQSGLKDPAVGVPGFAGWRNCFACACSLKINGFCQKARNMQGSGCPLGGPFEDD